MGISPFRTPLIEATLRADVRMPIFILAATHGNRVIELPADFPSRPDHLNRVGEMVREHYKRYRDAGFNERCPLRCYKYIVAPGDSYRFDLEGRLMRRAEDEPIEAGLRVGNRTITFRMLDRLGR